MLQLVIPIIIIMAAIRIITLERFMFFNIVLTFILNDIRSFQLKHLVIAISSFWISGIEAVHYFNRILLNRTEKIYLYLAASLDPVEKTISKHPDYVGTLGNQIEEKVAE